MATAKGTLTTDENNIPIQGGVNPSGQAQSFQLDADGKLLVSGSGGGGGGDVNIDQIGGQAVATDDETMAAGVKIIPVAAEYNATPNVYSDGDATVLQSDVNGALNTTITNASLTVDTGLSDLATETTLANIAADTANLDAPISGLALETGGNLDTIAGDTTSLDTKFGEVQAIPTANTLLGRLKDILDALASETAFPKATHTSPHDFSATNTSTTTITLSGQEPVIKNSQIVYIRYVPLLGSGAGLLINGQNGVTLTISGNVITVDGAGTPFLAGDDYEVGINYQEKSYDTNLDGLKVLEQAYAPRVATTQTLATMTPTSTSYVYTDAIDVSSFESFTIQYIKTASTSDDMLVRVVGVDSPTSMVYYDQSTLESPVSSEIPVSYFPFLLPAVAKVGDIPIPTRARKYVRIGFAKKTTLGTNSSITVTIAGSPR